MDFRSQESELCIVMPFFQRWSSITGFQGQAAGGFNEIKLCISSTPSDECWWVTASQASKYLSFSSPSHLEAWASQIGAMRQKKMAWNIMKLQFWVDAEKKKKKKLAHVYNSETPKMAQALKVTAFPMPSSSMRCARLPRRCPVPAITKWASFQCWRTKGIASGESTNFGLQIKSQNDFWRSKSQSSKLLGCFMTIAEIGPCPNDFILTLASTKRSTPLWGSSRPV